jgi:uncharacterized membrane protein YcaP (DUF421 family)
MSVLEAMFGSTGNVSWLQESARAVLIFAYGLLLVRLAGRRVFGRWSALDIVISIIVGSNLSRALTGNSPLFGTLAATTLLMAMHWLLAQGSARSRLLSRIVEGSPIPLAREGDVDKRKLRRQSVSDADLNEALRQSGCERVEETRLIMLEPSGKVSVLKKGGGAWNKG